MSSEPESDLEAMLEASASFAMPKRGELRTGRVISVSEQGLILDLGLKRDGVVSHADLEKLAEEGETFEPGQEVPVMILSTEDYSGNLVVSVYQARRSQDWLTAEQYMASGKIFEADIIGHNRGGLIVPFGDLRAFVPASHVTDVPRGLSEVARQERLASLVGKKYPFKVIEVNRSRRRLVLSQRAAQREWRDMQKARLLDGLEVGQRCPGVVSGLHDFGAFVDLGGADGLVHISELSWRRVRHPRDVLRVGEEVEVLVVKLDRESKRIGLSLKQLQPDPWERVHERFSLDQVLPGTVTRITSFGAFVELSEGIEGLLHSSQVGGGLDSLHEGQDITLRIVNIEADRHRIGLALHEAPTPGEELAPGEDTETIPAADAAAPEEEQAAPQVAGEELALEDAGTEGQQAEAPVATAAGGEETGGERTEQNSQA